MDDDYAGPIRRSMRLINIRVRIQKLGAPSYKQHFKTICKHTGNTIKNGFVSLDSDKIVYGSHRGTCFGCSENPKLINARRNKLKADSRDTIESCLRNLNLE
jgi:hypothetical protein